MQFENVIEEHGVYFASEKMKHCGTLILLPFIHATFQCCFYTGPKVSHTKQCISASIGDIAVCPYFI
jgi:hypothetical protein